MDNTGMENNPDFHELSIFIGLALLSWMTALES